MSCACGIDEAELRIPTNADLRIPVLLRDKETKQPYDLSDFAGFRFIVAAGAHTGTVVLDLDSESGSPPKIDRSDDAGGSLVLIIAPGDTAAWGSHTRYPSTLWGTDNAGDLIPLMRAVLVPIQTVPIPPP